MIHQRIEAAQRLFERHCLRPEVGQLHRLYPAQHAELGFRIAQAVEHHQTDQRLHVLGAGLRRVFRRSPEKPNDFHSSVSAHTLPSEHGLERHRR
jgi:hypothetical protein